MPTNLSKICVGSALTENYFFELLKALYPYFIESPPEEALLHLYIIVPSSNLTFSKKLT